MALEHFNRDVDRLKKQFLHLYAVVDGNLQDAIRALSAGDAALARQVVERDAEADTIEVEVEESCLKILALHQPVGHDLRYIAALIKINRNVERVGDYAVNMAKIAIASQTQGGLDLPADMRSLMDLAVSMMNRAFQAILRLDVELAREVWRTDDQANALADRLGGEVRAQLEARPDRVDSCLHLHSLVTILERICDYAKGIAKDVLYTELGEIVRHRGREFKRPGI